MILYCYTINDIYSYEVVYLFLNAPILDGSERETDGGGGYAKGNCSTAYGNSIHKGSPDASK